MKKKVIEFPNKEVKPEVGMEAFVEMDDALFDAMAKWYNLYRSQGQKIVSAFKELMKAKTPKSINLFQDKLVAEIAAMDLILTQSPKRIEKIVAPMAKNPEEGKE